MELDLSLAILLMVAALTSADQDDKGWVWKNKNSRYVEDDPRPSRRYEVEEERGYYGDYNRPGPGFIPDRPNHGLFVPQPHERPGGGVYDPNYLHGGYGNGGDRHPGILTGPVPSWEREPQFKDFDRCKCTEKFNCNTPGFSYGHCDVGKQYCCYSTKLTHHHGGPVQGRPSHSIDNGILVGPGGPVDYPNNPYPPVRPTFNRPIGSGVLVGPGGPTGVIGRPGSYSYRPPPGLGGAYARSTSKEEP